MGLDSRRHTQSLTTEMLGGTAAGRTCGRQLPHAVLRPMHFLPKAVGLIAQLADRLHPWRRRGRLSRFQTVRYLSLGGVELADFFQFHAQAMPQGTFRTQLFQQCFRLIKSIRRHILALEHVAKAALNFILGKQGDLPLSVPHCARGAARCGEKAFRELPESPGVNLSSILILLAAAPRAIAL